MSRLNTLLRASLESSDAHEEIGTGPSLEDYMDYRAALEEYEEADDIQSKLGELSDTLTEVEGVVEESRAQDGLTEDQVALQLEMVNNVREVIEGDVAQISIESFSSIESASLEASNASDGLLKRMWDGFVAMLRAIRDAFKKMWAWVFGGSKRADNAASEVAAAAKVAVEIEKSDAPLTQEVKEVAVTAGKQATTVADMRKANNEVIPMLGKEVGEIAKEVAADVDSITKVAKGGDVPEVSAPKDQTKAEKVKEDITVRVRNSAYMEAELSTMSSNQKAVNKREEFASEGTWTLSKSLNVLSTELKGYSGDVKKLTDILKVIDEAINRMESTLSSSAGRIEDSGSPKFKAYMTASMAGLRVNVSKLQGYRNTILAMLKKGDAAIATADGAAKKLSRAQLKKQQSDKARGIVS